MHHTTSSAHHSTSSAHHTISSAHHTTSKTQGVWYLGHLLTLALSIPFKYLFHIIHGCYAVHNLLTYVTSTQQVACTTQQAACTTRVVPTKHHTTSSTYHTTSSAHHSTSRANHTTSYGHRRTHGKQRIANSTVRSKLHTTPAKKSCHAKSNLFQIKSLIPCNTR